MNESRHPDRPVPLASGQPCPNCGAGVLYRRTSELSKIADPPVRMVSFRCDACDFRPRPVPRPPGRGRRTRGRKRDL